METHMTSVERIMEYAKFKGEESTVSTDSARTEKQKFSRAEATKRLSQITDKPNAPKLQKQTGEIIFENFNYNYYDNGPMILSDISLTIEPGQKIGVVGRTGAGKSSLISAIFRMRNGNEGSLSVNGKSANQTELNFLRSSLSIIPQVRRPQKILL